MERLQSASQMIDKQNYEGALIEFAKIIFYDKNSKITCNRLKWYSPRGLCWESRDLHQALRFLISHIKLQESTSAQTGLRVGSEAEVAVLHERSDPHRGRILQWCFEFGVTDQLRRCQVHLPQVKRHVVHMNILELSRISEQEISNLPSQR